MTTPRDDLPVAVVMERTAAPNAWEAWSHRVVEVVPGEAAFGTEPRMLLDDGKVSRWLHPGFAIALYADECKGYFLNLTSGQPAWFVSWMPAEGDASRVQVTGVSLSYIEADRRMTAEEHVESLPLPPELCEWLQDFTNAHFRPEGGRKVRAQSFLSPEERERQARALRGPGGAKLDPRALKAMFHEDPHFRQGDGLDVAAHDVRATAASPRERQRQIERARALGLLDDELKEQDKPQDDPPGAGPA